MQEEEKGLSQTYHVNVHPTTSSLLQNDEFATSSSLSSSLTFTNDNHHNHNNSNSNRNDNSNTRNIQMNEDILYPIVEVVAPATLRWGYTFDVEVNHEVLTVVVPFGGVKAGQTFQAQTHPKVQESTSLYRIPIGLWKDGLCDFLKYGPCHPSFLLSCLFPLVSLGQIYTRLELQWNGNPSIYVPSSSDESNNNDNNYHNNHRSQAFKCTVGITLGYIMIKQFILAMNMSFHSMYLCNLFYFIIITILVGKTRRYMRERYDIPATFTLLSRRYSTFARIFGYNHNNHHQHHDNYTSDDNHYDDNHYDDIDEENGVLASCCGEIEDYCLGGVFYPCVLSQMNRHTAMYDTYEASCCSSNGLPKHAPMMI